MRASELIKQLQAAKRKHGDLEVVYPGVFQPMLIRCVGKGQDGRGDFIAVQNQVVPEELRK